MLIFISLRYIIRGKDEDSESEQAESDEEEEEERPPLYIV